MKIHLMSDLHLEFYKNDGQSFLDTLKGDAFVCVLAGDITTAKNPNRLRTVFETCSKVYPYTIYVPGNHEIYGTTLENAWNNINEAKLGLDNVFALHCFSVTINGYRFIGDTAWFRDDPLNVIWENCISDFSQIKNYRKWVYKEQELFERYLNKNLQEGDILVTHHLTTPLSIASRFKNEETNRFFLCDYSELILERKPLLSLHGHTHDTFDYKLGDTRVVANPKGYIGENRGKYEPKLIEV